MPSFDVVSKVALHEVDNAVQQASKEVSTRYDFRDTGSSVERTDLGIMLRSNSERLLEAVRTVLREKIVRRQLSPKCLDAQKVEPAGGANYRQLIKIHEGISTEKAKEVVKFLKTSGLKVQASIQQDQVRVTGKKRDDLQSAIAAMKAHDFDLDLQFENFRD